MNSALVVVAVAAAAECADDLNFDLL